MKMAPSLFWGMLLIIIGLSAIFRIVFDVNLFGIFFSLLLIFAGVTMVIGKPWFFQRSNNEYNTFLDDRAVTVQPRDQAEYNVVFGKTVYDLRGVQFPDNEPIRIKINTVFGNSLIVISKDSPVKIKSDAVFAGASMPDGNSVAFGSIQYKTEPFGMALNHLIIDAPVVFGSLQVRAE
jgi:predicted membrane protein